MLAKIDRKVEQVREAIRNPFSTIGECLGTEAAEARKKHFMEKSPE